MAVWEIDKSDLCEGNLGLRAVRFRCIDVGPQFPISTVRRSDLAQSPIV